MTNIFLILSKKKHSPRQYDGDYDFLFQFTFNRLNRIFCQTLLNFNLAEMFSGGALDVSVVPRADTGADKPEIDVCKDSHVTKQTFHYSGSSVIRYGDMSAKAGHGTQNRVLGASRNQTVELADSTANHVFQFKIIHFCAVCQHFNHFPFLFVKVFSLVVLSFDIFTYD